MKPYYSHNGITIYHSDWKLVPLGLLKTDLLLSDPPYGLSEAAGKNKSRNKAFGSKTSLSKNRVIMATDYGVSDWDDEPPTEADISLMRSLAAHQIIFGGNYFHLPPSSCYLVWDKINSGDFADCELAWTNLKKAVRQFRYMWNGMLREGDDIRIHPTQKPLALMKWCLTQAPKDIKSVVDPYMGSGTTLVAAKHAGLTAIGCDLDERYCEGAAKRLEQEVFDFGSAVEI